MPSIESALTHYPSVPLRERALLLAHSLGKSREWVMAYPEAELAPEQYTAFTQLAAQAAQGTPLPYLLGEWEFFGLQFNVTPAVLIPRPETELLVEKVIGSGLAARRILDVGTGSGILAITLALKLPQVQITALDISPAALAVAAANAKRHNVAERIEFIESDLLASVNKSHLPFDLILANLPYIPSAELESLPVAQHEPRLALDGGPEGLTYLRRLLTEAPQLLAPGGRVLLEIEYRQGAQVTALAHAAFSAAQVDVHQDLAGLDRVVEITVSA